MTIWESEDGSVIVMLEGNKAVVSVIVGEQMHVSEHKLGGQENAMGNATAHFAMSAQQLCVPAN